MRSTTDRFQFQSLQSPLYLVLVLSINLMPGAHFKQGETGATEDCGSCEMHLFGRPHGKQRHW